MDRLDSTHGKRKDVDITIIIITIVTIIIPIIRTTISRFLMSATPF